MRHESMAHPLFRFFNRPTDITLSLQKIATESHKHQK